MYPVPKNKEEALELLQKILPPSEAQIELEALIRQHEQGSARRRAAHVDIS